MFAFIKPKSEQDKQKDKWIEALKICQDAIDYLEKTITLECQRQNPEFKDYASIKHMTPVNGDPAFQLTPSVNNLLEKRTFFLNIASLLLGEQSRASFPRQPDSSINHLKTKLGENIDKPSIIAGETLLQRFKNASTHYSTHSKVLDVIRKPEEIDGPLEAILRKAHHFFKTLLLGRFQTRSAAKGEELRANCLTLRN